MHDARPAFAGCSGRSGARGAGEREQPSAGAGARSPHWGNVGNGRRQGSPTGLEHGRVGRHTVYAFPSRRVSSFSTAA
jgi:hypothetical protein